AGSSCAIASMRSLVSSAYGNFRFIGSGMKIACNFESLSYGSILWLAGLELDRSSCANKLGKAERRASPVSAVCFCLGPNSKKRGAECQRDRGSPLHCRIWKTTRRAKSRHQRFLVGPVIFAPAWKNQLDLARALIDQSNLFLNHDVTEPTQLRSQSFRFRRHRMKLDICRDNAVPGNRKRAARERRSDLCN